MIKKSMRVLAAVVAAFVFSHASASQDTTPPTSPTNLAATSITSSKIDLSWTAATDDTGVAGYVVYRNCVSIATNVQGAVYHDTGLAAQTNYVYAVSAFDAAGNSSPPPVCAAATTPSPDASPPTTPGNLAATAPSPSQVNLTWTASTDNTGVTGYAIYRDSAIIASATDPAYQDNTVAPSTSYSYSVTAQDASGNSSAQSAPATVTTPAVPPPPDTTPPTAPALLDAESASSTEISLSWAAATDDTGVTEYQIYRDGAFIGLSVDPFYSDTGLLPSSSHSYTVVARDAAGNSSTTSSSVSHATLSSAPITATGPLYVLPSNARYFTDDGTRAVFLTGSHTWSNLVDNGSIDPPPVFDNAAYLDFMAAHHSNFARLWAMELPRICPDLPDCVTAPPFKWVRSGPGLASDGKPKFDLSKMNQSYFDRVRSRVTEAGQRGIYVSVMLFMGFEWQFNLSENDGNPMIFSNNVNGIDCPGTCPTDSSQIPATLWNIEQGYIRKLVDTVNDLDNVLYEVSNEAGPYSTAWQYNVINYVKTYEAAKTKQHPIGMTFQYSGGSDAALYASPADWVSPSANLPTNPGAKVVIEDTDHAYPWPQMKGDGQAAQRAWVWKNLATGNNPAFMDPYLVVIGGRNAPVGSTSDPGIGAAPDPYWDVLRNSMGDALTYANKIGLAAMTPQPSLSSTGFCLANSGVEYLAYQPGSGAFTINVPAGVYAFEWFDAGSRAVAGTGSAGTPGGSTLFTPPFSGDAVLWLKSAPDTAPPSVPSGLAGNATSSTQVSLTWAASADNVAVSGYGVFRDGVQIAAPSTNNYSDTGLTASTTYTYAVSAYDAAGNVSAQSSTVQVTTPSAADTTPPTVSITAPAAGATVSGPITVSASAADNVGVAGVQFKLDGANLGAEDTAAPYSVSWDTTTASNGAHSLTAVARDAAGNTTTSAAVSVTVSNAPPAIAYVQSRGIDCGVTTGCSLAFSANNGAAHLLVVAVRIGISGKTLTVADTRNNSYALAKRQSDVEGNEGFIYYAKNSAAGSNTVSVGMNGEADSLRWAVHEFSGLSTSAPLDKAGSSSGTGTATTSGSVTTAAASELIFGFSEVGDAPSWTAGSGYTLLEHPANKIGTEYKIASSILTTSAGFAISPSDNWAGFIVTFK